MPRGKQINAALFDFDHSRFAPLDCRQRHVAFDLKEEFAPLLDVEVLERVFGPPTNITLSCFLCIILLQIGGANSALCSSYHVITSWTASMIRASKCQRAAEPLLLPDLITRRHQLASSDARAKRHVVIGALETRASTIPQ